MVGARCAGSGYFGTRYVAGSNPVIDSGSMWRNWQTRRVNRNRRRLLISGTLHLLCLPPKYS